MESKDIRWVQRFNNFTKALMQLSRFAKKENLNEFELQGLIKSFEYNYELAWNTIKDFYEHQAETGIQGSRDAVRLAFKRGLIENGETWMKMIESRNQTSHTYNEKITEEISTAILDSYYQEFVKLQQKFEELSKEEEK